MDLRYKHEKPLFVILATLSIIVWSLAIIGTLGIFLLYPLFGFIAYLFIQSAFISYIKGTGVKVGPEQYADLHEQFLQCCQKLDIKEIPQLYLINGDGMFNALATKFLGKKYVVLFSNVVEALETQPGGIAFYMGHELAHIKLNHLNWSVILLPFTWLPLIGTAYHRAKEYSCDMHGAYCCNNVEDACHALGVLAAGSTRWFALEPNKYTEQVKETSGFWMSFNELINDYPWLVKRMQQVINFKADTNTTFPSRNILAWILALFVPRTAMGPGFLIVVLFIGILAAVAIPAAKKLDPLLPMLLGLPSTSSTDPYTDGSDSYGGDSSSDNTDITPAIPEDESQIEGNLSEEEYQEETPTYSSDDLAGHWCNTAVIDADNTKVSADKWSIVGNKLTISPKKGKQVQDTFAMEDNVIKTNKSGDYMIVDYTDDQLTLEKDSTQYLLQKGSCE